MSAYDPDTNAVYSPSLYSVDWYVTVATEEKVTNTTDSSEAQYVLHPDGSLRVKRNIPVGSPTNIRCVVEYIDPRDTSTTHITEGVVVLATNRDATAVFDTINILSEKSVIYDPLTDSTSTMTFTAEVMRKGEDVTSGCTIQWYASEEGGTAALISDSDLFYVSGQGTTTLTIDALYTEKCVITARAVRNGDLLPCRSDVSVTWEAAAISASAYSPQGSAVRYGGGWKAFGTVVNIRNAVLTDTVKSENLLMKWKRREGNSSAETVMSWGQMTSAPASELVSQCRTTLVWPEIYLVGPFRKVTYNNDNIVHDGKIVVMRTE